MSKIALLTSQDRIDQEHGMLNRLAVGLMNDGDQVMRVIPPYTTDIPPEYEQSVSLIPKLHIPFTVPYLHRKEQIRTLTDVLSREKVTTLVCFGTEAKKLGSVAAPQLEASLICEVLSMREASKVKKSAPVTRWFGATPSLERTIRDRVGEDRAAFVPLGVAPAPPPAEQFNPETKFAVVLHASDCPKSTFQILDAIKEIPEIHLLLELGGKKDHKIWSAIAQTNLLARTTCLKDVAALRPLILQADLILLPSHLMPVRTILLEAMERNVPVIAPTIPGFDFLVEGETYISVKGSWEEPLRRVLSDQELANRIGESATSLIASNYSSAAQIAALQAAVTLF
ncbi:MAG: glycosyltransferase [Phycisphaerales bacterium]|jgi:glycosyltransferase involved in cell wall biosynthesis|nr:glycosyltransferase [Phycisphaerales bacterium]